MTIRVGESIPNTTVKEMVDGTIHDRSTAELFDGKTVVLFGVPGAYTPTCNEKHLPSYLEHSEALRKKGVDEILCLAVNDPFVTGAWSSALGAAGRVRVLADWKANFANGLGLTFDGSGAGLGTRSKRFSMIVKNGVVTQLDVEDSPGAMDVSGAKACLSRL